MWGQFSNLATFTFYQPPCDNWAMPCCQVTIPEVSKLLIGHFVGESQKGGGGKKQVANWQHYLLESVVLAVSIDSISQDTMVKGHWGACAPVWALRT